MYYLNAFNDMVRKRQESQMGDARDLNPGWTNMSNEAKASYYGQNPTMAAITQAGQKAFGMTSYGQLQNALAPNFVSEQRAIAQGPMAYSGFNNFGKESSLPSGGIVSPGMSGVSTDTGLQGQFDAGQTGLYGDANAGRDGYGGFNGGGLGGSGDGAAGVGGEFGLYNQGGMVDARHLKGRAPAPDDGYGALQGGEYVITKAAVEKYGKRLLDAINNGTFR